MTASGFNQLILKTTWSIIKSKHPNVFLLCLFTLHLLPLYTQAPTYCIVNTANKLICSQLPFSEITLHFTWLYSMYSVYHPSALLGQSLTPPCLQSCTFAFKVLHHQMNHACYFSWFPHCNHVFLCIGCTACLCGRCETNNALVRLSKL